MPGHTLTIKNCTVSFSEPGKIIVRQNGKLILENAILTTKCENAMWGGIEVYGNSGFPQSDLTYHGYVEMNNSTIENSTCGITTVQYEYNQDSGGAVPVPLMSGGKITAVNSKFINNYLAVEFYPYSFENESSFNYCTFKTTDDYVGTDGPDYFVRMSGVNGIPFTCCSFINTRISNIGFERWGGGIYSFNSSLDIQNQGCSSIGSTLFQGLTRGIYAINSGDDQTISVKNADFIDNYRGIYLSGMSLINPASVVSCNFQICNPPSQIEMYPYGLYLDNCTSYKIEENLFKSTNTPFPLEHIKIGLIVNNSGPDPNQIYRNKFENLYSGIIAQNKNRSINGSTGLEIKCNIFSGEDPDDNKDCLYDISVTINEDGLGSEEGIKADQGTNVQYPQAPAGNIFSDIVFGMNQYQYINYGNHITYWQNSTITNNDPIVQPKRYNVDDPPLFTPLDNPGNYQFIDWNYCCPPNYLDYTGEPDSLKQTLLNTENEIDSIQTALSIITDGGNTFELNNLILASIPSDSILIRNELLAFSPFLSDSVLKSAIRKEEVLTAGLVTQILSANPQTPKSTPLMTALDSRIAQLSDEQWFDVLNGIEVISAKEELEKTLSSKMTQQSECIRKLISKYKTLYSPNLCADSITNLLYEHGTLASKYDLVIQCLCNNDSVGAKIAYKNIPASYSLSLKEQEEYEAFGHYLSLKITLLSRNNSLLSSDSILINTLKTLQTGSGSITDAYSRGYLIALDSLTYSEPIILPQQVLKSSNRIRVKSPAKNETSEYSVFPNPANSYVIIKYNGIDATANHSLDITNIHNQKIMEIQLGKSNSYRLLDVSFLKAGQYILEFSKDGQPKEVKKLIILN